MMFTTEAKRVCKSAWHAPLDMAYKRVKSAGYVLRIDSIDDELRDVPPDTDLHRINVNVQDGVVVRSWIG